MKKLVLALLFLSFVMVSCSDGNDDNDTPTAPTQSMTVTKNGVDFQVSSPASTLISTTQLGETGKRLDVNATVDEGQFVLSISNWDWQNPPENGLIQKTYYTNNTSANACQSSNGYTYCDGGLITYKPSGSNASLLSNMETVDEGYITITANNTGN